MVQNNLSTIVKAVRLRYAVPFALMLAAVYWVNIRPWMANWGSSAAEQQITLPGDDLIPAGAGQSTLALTINAPADTVWQWLVQIGQDRAGFYTYTWLENLIGADIHNADEIHPEWQNFIAGDTWRLVPPNYLWGLGKDAVEPVLFSDPGHALVVEMFGAHIIEPIDEQTTRLIVRGQSGPANFIKAMVLDPLVFTLERRMLLGLKARAEGLPDAPAVLMAIAQIGWAAAGITVAYLFISQPGRRLWLSIPILAAMPALLMSSDFQAALAAFISVGITILGFLIFGRSWLGSLLIIGSVVMLTLLLAPEAYTAIGLTFALLFLPALIVVVINRSRTGGNTEEWLAVPMRRKG